MSPCAWEVKIFFHATMGGVLEDMVVHDYINYKKITTLPRPSVFHANRCRQATRLAYTCLNLLNVCLQIISESYNSIIILSKFIIKIKKPKRKMIMYINKFLHQGFYCKMKSSQRISGIPVLSLLRHRFNFWLGN